jgi:hypothetical protein
MKPPPAALGTVGVIGVTVVAPASIRPPVEVAWLWVSITVSNIGLSAWRRTQPAEANLRRG